MGNLDLNQLTVTGSSRVRKVRGDMPLPKSRSTSGYFRIPQIKCNGPSIGFDPQSVDLFIRQNTERRAAFSESSVAFSSQLLCNRSDGQEEHC
jgi:hypothetical protein